MNDENPYQPPDADPHRNFESLYEKLRRFGRYRPRTKDYITLACVGYVAVHVLFNTLAYLGVLPKMGTLFAF